MLKLSDNAVLSDGAKTNVAKWLNEDKYLYYRKELEELVNLEKWTELEDSFFRVLPIGTGGRRGTCGIGSNRVNRVTVGEIVQALCQYLKELNDDKVKLKVAVAYDSRNTSKEFAEYCCRVLSGNNIDSYIFDGPRATPQLSFVVKDKGFDAGIVITASHNPSPDNGIKLYWGDGGQLVAPHDKNILDIAQNITHITESSTDLKSDGNIHYFDQEQDQRYWGAALSLLKNEHRGLKIAYSPLHGTGVTSVLPVLEQAGFDTLMYTPQSKMDGNFPNIENNIPNPEVPIANSQVAEFALEHGCDIATTNDPDADRFCILVNDGSEMIQLNGNQTAVLMTDYVLSTMQESNELTSKHFIASTIVTTDMLNVLATKYGVNSISNLLVGFKYIGEQIFLRQDRGDEIFVSGGEESYGGIIGDYCRDKDAAGPTAVVAELASVLKLENKTLLDKLDELYLEHGYFLEDLHSIGFPGSEGFKQMKSYMKMLRLNPPLEMAGLTIENIRDYSLGIEIEGKKENVLRFEFSDDTRNRITVRPSGTEPKIKVYIQVFEEVEGSLQDSKGIAQKRVDDLKQYIIKSIEDHTR
jgi:phosphoglucomutase